jgi:curli biogenesis system outer membrane secretion channel CsgG
MVFALLASTLGCIIPKAHEAHQLVQPKTRPVRTLTSFSGSLRCMDDLFVSHGVQGHKITSVGIPDSTGQVSVGARDMLISAISRMTMRSDAFHYLDFDLARTELNYINANDPQQAVSMPKHYIRGSITQLDKNVTDWRVGGGISGQQDIYGADAAVDFNETTSVIALDLNIGEVSSRRIIPGVSASNSLAISRDGAGGEAGLTIKNVGAFFSLELAKSEGAHQSVRTLIELGAVELLGKLTHVPYWECLNVPGTDPKVMGQVSDWYSDMSDEDRAEFVQRVLVGNGYLPADHEITSRITPASRYAISIYELNNDLLPVGAINFDLFRTMLGTRRGIDAGKPDLGRKSDDHDFAKQQIPRREPVEVTIKSLRGQAPSFIPSESLQVSVSVSKSAHLYCYYEDSAGWVSQVFPNRFAPDSYVAGGDRVQIPTKDAPFEIVFENPGTVEELVCLGSDRDLHKQLPQHLRESDLEPLGVADADAMIAAYRKLDPTGIGVDRLHITIAEGN